MGLVCVSGIKIVSTIDYDSYANILCQYFMRADFNSFVFFGDTLYTAISIKAVLPKA